MANSTQISEISRLTAKIDETEKRIVTLEKRVAELEAQRGRVDDESESFEGDFGDDGSDLVEPEPVKPKRGRRPRVSEEDFALRRDNLVRFIELRWPKLESHFHRYATIKGVLAALNAASPGAEHTWAYRHLVDHIATLWEFLTSGRYVGEPRQIANAIAGAPELAWRTSLDRGMAHPTALHILLPAFVSHIRRHNPQCLIALSQSGATPDTLALLRRCCAECRRLTSKPERVNLALEKGLPRCTDNDATAVR